MCINWVWVISVDWLFLSPLPQAVHEGVSTWPHPHWQLVLSRCLILARVTDTEQYLTAVVICLPLITEGFDMFLICCWPFGFPLQYILCSCFLPILSWKFLSLCCFFFCRNSLYISGGSLLASNFAMHSPKGHMSINFIHVVLWIEILNFEATKFFSLRLWSWDFVLK